MFVADAHDGLAAGGEFPSRALLHADESMGSLQRYG